MDDKRTPMAAEVQELPAQQQDGCRGNSYGTAARPKPMRSYVGIWIWMGLLIFVVCTVCVVTAVKHVSIENGEEGLRITIRNVENTNATEDPVQHLEMPQSDHNKLDASALADEVRLPAAPDSGRSMSPAEIYESVAAAVVGVEFDSYYNSVFCTGVVVSSDGCILSASNNLSSSETILVSFSDGKVLSAKSLGEDSTTGVCLLKVEAEDLPTVCFSEGAEPRVGQNVYSICNPYGSQIPNVFRAGMISAVSSVQLGKSTFRLLQSSEFAENAEYGCPILDESGMLIGLTSPVGLRVVTGADPCFALSYEDLVRIVSDLERPSSDCSVWLGFEVTDIPEEYLKFFRFPGSVWIEQVSVDAAGYGTLFPYDIITAVDGIEITSAEQFETVLASYQPGERILLTIYRSGRFSSYYLSVSAR